MLPISKTTILGREYTFTTLGGHCREFVGDGCSGVGRRLQFLEPCAFALGENKDHLLLRVYRRRIRDLFTKSYWYACTRCDGFWPA